MPGSPFRQGYTLYGRQQDTPITATEVRDRLPAHVRLWDGSDGTPAVSVIQTPEGKYRIRVIALASGPVPLAVAPEEAT